MSPRPSITPRADPNVLPDACGLSTLTRDRSLLKSDRVPRNQARLLISCSSWLTAPPGCLSFSGQRLCLSQPPILGNQGTHHRRYTWLSATQRLHFKSLIWFSVNEEYELFPLNRKTADNKGGAVIRSICIWAFIWAQNVNKEQKTINFFVLFHHI